MLSQYGRGSHPSPNLKKSQKSPLTKKWDFFMSRFFIDTEIWNDIYRLVHPTSTATLLELWDIWNSSLRGNALLKRAFWGRASLEGHLQRYCYVIRAFILTILKGHNGWALGGFKKKLLKFNVHFGHIWPFMAIWPSANVQRIVASGVSLKRTIKM